jgi:glutaredoxin 2
VENLFEGLKWLWNNATPKVTLACVIVIAVLQYFQNKKQSKTAETLAEHLNPKNKYPHPECEWGDKSYELLKTAVETNREENRDDHQIIFNLLRGLPVSEEAMKKRTEKKR